MECPRCGSKRLYLLSNGQLKCGECGKKFSPQKLKRDKEVAEYFCLEMTAYECAKKLGLHYFTVQKRYELFRQKIAAFMQAEFEKKHQTIAFEEYIYLPGYKRGQKKAIFDGINFLTFNFDGKIYNILMPDLTRYKSSFLADGLDTLYYKEFERFLRYGKIQSENIDPLIRSFWDYLESLLQRYKGIKKENFFYYLKEAEFKFSYNCKKLERLL